VLQRFAAAIIGVFVIGAVAAPSATPARGDGPVTIAVNTFQNDAGAPPNVVSALSDAAYRAIATSGKFTAKGGGPLPARQTLTQDQFIDALAAAAKAGADEVVLGDVVQSTGGQVYYRLSLYRVAPVTFIGSQIFSQSYPPADAQSIAAALASNLATLGAPRQGTGTIYSTTQGPVADVGSQDGFVLGDRFNVMRNGQKVAEATISSIRDDEAGLTIANASPGYSPAIGDELIGLRALPPLPPAPAQRSTFSVFSLIAAVGGALLAIGHHGQPGNFCASCATPTPGSSPFDILFFTINGHPPSGFVEFTFSQVINSASQTAIQAQTTYASFTLQPPGSQATTQPAPLSQLGAVTFTTDPTGTQSILDVGESMPGLVTGEIFQISFTNLVTAVSGAALVPESTGNQTLSIARRVVGPAKPSVGPVAPGPGKPGGPKPVPNPKGPPPGVPKPIPPDPHVPH
jgi:hypothetical protein